MIFSFFSSSSHVRLSVCHFYQGAHEFANAMTSCRHLQCIDEGVGRGDYQHVELQSPHLFICQAFDLSASPPFTFFFCITLCSSYFSPSFYFFRSLLCIIPPLFSLKLFYLLIPVALSCVGLLSHNMLKDTVVIIIIELFICRFVDNSLSF